jgi:TonB family protein
MQRSIFLPVIFLLSSLSPALAQQPTTPTNAQTPSSAPAAKPAHPPVPIKTVDPEIPSAARDKKENGICVVRMMVDIEGKPKDLQVLRCSNPIFEPNTMKTVAQYRFRPATDDKDKPVAVQITIVVNFRFFGVHHQTVGRTPTPQIAYAFSTLPGTTSYDPDANGVYPLGKQMELPEFKTMNDTGYSEAAVMWDNGVSCNIVLTISAKGKPSDPQLLFCDKKNLEKPAVDTLMNSQFKPAKLNGKPVAVRTSIRMVYKGFAPMR